MDQSELTGKIIGCALKVHSILGPGLQESAYRICLTHDLRKVHCKVQDELDQEKQQLEDSTTRRTGGTGGGGTDQDRAKDRAEQARRT